MTNYQEGKIYKIYNTINDEIYIGSTTQKLCERMAQHRSKHRNECPVALVYKAFNEHGVENFFIELVEKCPCNDKDELRKKEGEYIRALKPVLNKNIAGRTKQDYEVEHKEAIAKRKKEYRERDIQRYSQKQKEYYNSNTEAIKQRHKEFRNNNIEYEKQRHKKYYEEVSKQSFECECGCVVKRGCLSRHRKTKKHIELMKDKLN